MSVGDNELIIQGFWRSYWDLQNEEGDPVPKDYQAWRFGNTPDMADRLGELVRIGIKTATASLAWSYETGEEPYPETGGYSVILDGDGEPLCIIKTTSVAVHPFNEVSQLHAYQEGEGDRSLEHWRQVHWDFFSEECARIGKHPDERMPVVCETFELVYP